MTQCQVLLTFKYMGLSCVPSWSGVQVSATSLHGHRPVGSIQPQTGLETLECEGCCKQ